MPEQGTIDDALKMENLDLPKRPIIEEVRADYIEDSSGEDSLEIWVVLSDSTDDDELTGEVVVQIKSAISESLQKNQIDLFPYIRFIKHADYHSGETRE